MATPTPPTAAQETTNASLEKWHRRITIIGIVGFVVTGICLAVFHPHANGPSTNILKSPVALAAGALLFVLFLGVLVVGWILSKKKEDRPGTAPTSETEQTERLGGYLPLLLFLVAAIAIAFAVPRWWPSAPRGLVVAALIGICLLFYGWFRKAALALAIVATLAIFVAGGWGNLIKASSGDYPDYNPDPLAISPNLYTEDAKGTNDHSAENTIAYFDIVMKGNNGKPGKGIFGEGGHVRPPLRIWQNWRVYWASNEPDRYVGFICTGSITPIGPFGTDLPRYDDPRFSNGNCDEWLVQGKGTLRYEMTQPKFGVARSSLRASASTTSTLFAPPTSGNPFDLLKFPDAPSCADAEGEGGDMRKFPEDEFILEGFSVLGCWGRKITLPDRFDPNWCWTPDPSEPIAPDWKILFQLLKPDGSVDRVEGPFKQGDTPSPVGWPLTFRLRGHALPGIQFQTGHWGPDGSCVAATTTKSGAPK